MHNLLDVYEWMAESGLYIEVNAAARDGHHLLYLMRNRLVEIACCCKTTKMANIGDDINTNPHARRAISDMIKAYGAKRFEANVDLNRLRWREEKRCDDIQASSRYVIWVPLSPEVPKAAIKLTGLEAELAEDAL